MDRRRRLIVLGSVASALGGCKLGDPNAQPEFSESSGLPKNCRAIVQANIDGYRTGEFDADGVMDSLERNCGAHGYSWGYQ